MRFPRFCVNFLFEKKYLGSNLSNARWYDLGLNDLRTRIELPIPKRTPLKKKISRAKKKEFDRYWHYLESVQSADVDAKFIRRVYRELKSHYPKSLREDFCGTFHLCAEWVKLNKRNSAVGIDLDTEPIQYGMKHVFPKLQKTQQKRLKTVLGNVLDAGLPNYDVIAAFNFSYFIFKERQVLRRYFRECFKQLNKDGLFILDCFGGFKVFKTFEERTKHGDFTYYWHQVSFDPINHHTEFDIHFKRDGEKKRTSVFSYDWRIWTIPELRDLLEEVGFKKVHIYWEGNDKHGGGNGKFNRVTEGEICESWIAYIAAEKDTE